MLLGSLWRRYCGLYNLFSSQWSKSIDPRRPGLVLNRYLTDLSEGNNWSDYMRKTPLTLRTGSAVPGNLVSSDSQFPHNLGTSGACPGDAGPGEPCSTPDSASVWFQSESGAALSVVFGNLTTTGGDASALSANPGPGAGA